MKHILFFILILISYSVKSQTKITIVTDSLGFEKTYHYNVEFLNPYCVKCHKVASMWSKEWYCKKHYKKLKHDNTKNSSTSHQTRDF